MPYFQSMHRIQINKLINSFSSLTFQRGQYVLREGPLNLNMPLRPLSNILESPRKSEKDATSDKEGANSPLQKKVNTLLQNKVQQMVVGTSSPKAKKDQKKDDK